MRRSLYIKITGEDVTSLLLRKKEESLYHSAENSSPHLHFPPCSPSLSSSFASSPFFLLCLLFLHRSFFFALSSFSCLTSSHAENAYLGKDVQAPAYTCNVFCFLSLSLLSFARLFDGCDEEEETEHQSYQEEEELTAMLLSD